MDLTKKQQQLFDYLQEALQCDGQTPSLRQSAEDMGVSHNAVAQLITQLEKKGVIAREGRYSRSIRILPEGCAGGVAAYGRELPVIGQITAGLPMYAQQEWESTVLVDGRMFPGNNLFCLRIKGQSMKNSGILDGDLVVCEPRQFAENGEIVAVLIDGEEATVKRFYLGANYVELRPENDQFKPTRYPFADIMVQGKVLGVIRSFDTIL